MSSVIQQPAFTAALGLQPHRSRIRTGRRLGVAANSTSAARIFGRTRTSLSGRDADQCLADHAGTLAKLRRTHAGTATRSAGIRRSLAILTAVLPGPGDTQPAAACKLLHEGAARRRVGKLGEVLAMQIHHVRIVVLAQELAHVTDNCFSSSENSKSIARSPPCRKWLYRFQLRTGASMEDNDIIVTDPGRRNLGNQQHCPSPTLRLPSAAPSKLRAASFWIGHSRM